jgi:hypothetical protein
MKEVSAATAKRYAGSPTQEGADLYLVATTFVQLQ